MEKKTEKNLVFWQTGGGVQTISVFVSSLYSRQNCDIISELIKIQ